MLLACLTIMFVGPHVPDFAPLIRRYEVWLWLFLLLSGFYSLSFPAQWLWNTGHIAVAKRHAFKLLVNRLHSLTVGEKISCKNTLKKIGVSSRGLRTDWRSLHWHTTESSA